METYCKALNQIKKESLKNKIKNKKERKRDTGMTNQLLMWNRCASQVNKGYGLSTVFTSLHFELEAFNCYPQSNETLHWASLGSRVVSSTFKLCGGVGSRQIISLIKQEGKERKERKERKRFMRMEASYLRSWLPFAMPSLFPSVPSPLNSSS